ncbi:hypothetical protein HDV64DRAFT_192591 [Trichoderma sp. TUCIM 5745]
MANGDPVLWSLYVYAPNHGAPVCFAVAFAISAVFHIWQCFRYKAFRLVWLQSVCAVLFAAGFACREYSSYHYIYEPGADNVLIPFILAQVFIYACPPLLELSNYHVLGRVFFYVPHCAPLPASSVLRIFGGIMTIVEALNGVGASLSSNPSASPGTQTLGSHLILAVLIIQLVVITIFVGMTSTFHVKCIKASIPSKAVYALLFTLYMSMTLIFIRCIYRLVEHTGDTKVDITDLEALKQLNPLLRYEVYFYIFEATLMLLNSILWNVWNAGRLLPANPHIYLAQDGIEAMVEVPPDTRSIWQKGVNMWTFGLLYGKKTPVVRLEELTEYSRVGGNEQAGAHMLK